MVKDYVDMSDPAYDDGTLLWLTRDEAFILASAIHEIFTKGESELVMDGRLDDIRRALEWELGALL